MESKNLIADWLKFAADVEPDCAAGEDWLNSLKARSKNYLETVGYDDDQQMQTEPARFVVLDNQFNFVAVEEETNVLTYFQLPIALDDFVQKAKDWKQGRVIKTGDKYIFQANHPRLLQKPAS